MAAGVSTAAAIGLHATLEVFKVSFPRPAPLHVEDYTCARPHACGVVEQHIPYVKTMLGGVILLKLACSQAVQNKERCAELAECVPRCLRRRGYCIEVLQIIARAPARLAGLLLRCSCGCRAARARLGVVLH